MVLVLPPSRVNYSNDKLTYCLINAVKKRFRPILHTDECWGEMVAFFETFLDACKLFIHQSYFNIIHYIILFSPENQAISSLAYFFWDNF